MEDSQTLDLSNLPLREDSELLQVAAMMAFIGCGESLQDGAVLLLDKMNMEKCSGMKVILCTAYSDIKKMVLAFDLKSNAAFFLF